MSQYPPEVQNTHLYQSPNLVTSVAAESSTPLQGTQRESPFNASVSAVSQVSTTTKHWTKEDYEAWHAHLAKAELMGMPPPKGEKIEGADHDPRWEQVTDSETDPTGRSAHDLGAKLDAGKVLMSLVLDGFAPALFEVAKVATHGAEKYARDSWKEVPDGVFRYTNAMYRHQVKEAQGESHDPDSELLHSAHQCWNSLARLTLILKQRG